MKLPERDDIEVKSNFKSDSVPLSLYAPATNKLMTILTELYPRPIYACIREYVSNAYDSHIQAGVKRPFEVSLPSYYNPVLIIKDFGVGLSEWEFKNVYALYGKSTKEHTDEQIGMLGLGCKSALAYTAQFTVVGIKGGVKTTVSVARTSDGGGELNIIKGGELTNEPDGVEVSIPCREADVSRFEREAKKLFKYNWHDKVLVNGHKPERVKGLNVTDNIILREIGSSYEAGYDPNSVIVMGGIPYKTDYDFGINDKYAVIAFVDIGVVEPSPDRESLKETPRTFEALASVKKQVVDGLAKSIKKEVVAAKTKWEAAATLNKHKHLVDLREAKIKYRGVTIPVDVEVPCTVSAYDSYRISDHSSKTFLHVDTYHDCLLVTGWNIKFNVTHKKKAVKFIDDHDDSMYTAKNIVFLDELPKQLKGWIDPKKIVKWEDLRKIKLPTVRTSQLASAGTYDIVTPDAAYLVNTPATDIDETKPLFFKTVKRWSHSDTAILNRFHKKGWTCVYVAGNRKAKFQRLFPTAKELSPEISKLRDKVKKTLTNEERSYLSINNKSLLKQFDETKIKDRELKKFIRLSKKSDKFVGLTNLMRSFYTEDIVKTFNPLDSYPLVSTMREHGLDKRKKEHVYLYINAVYSSTT
jgi:hypothetical protein